MIPSSSLHKRAFTAAQIPLKLYILCSTARWKSLDTVHLNIMLPRSSIEIISTNIRKKGDVVYTWKVLVQLHFLL